MKVTLDIPTRDWNAFKQQVQLCKEMEKKLDPFNEESKQDHLHVIWSIKAAAYRVIDAEVKEKQST